ncbi:NADH dehydrogenase [Staphylococcus saprophyticus]|jgi:NADH dehydrogenase|uniref:Type II NADH:quinone oxidoreductase n=1 Tax=Staphylococcus saprophyticus TaxID=29385 RepID=A0A380HPG6_STASA|nr:MULTISPECIES: NAD(P)/FAD-dependent oxidoreductase [Staphylococcus]AMG20916.1 NAD(P)/FAD-dependent oxidoreductase [Staphylococcus saprophyticus]AMG33986.1 NAD(P)/FAD-dependent oxidoreductase [Staphylococcus saprophyticus]EHY92026.1 putative NADH dehydrogenase FAD-containing subunit [Staphylococcus saprophyticus subsp. saprophyticus KACC 16562]KIJ87239.1 NADH dehydrogenase [Staphylococcus saprophyticus]MBC2921612.1 NAD(P)/FAD-dependent oxidoreductase [Staphylococcus saprophyticus]
MKNLVLLGGGYGNMRIMSHILPSALPENYSITLIDRMPYHGLKPEFYELAAGTKSDKDIRMSFPDSDRINNVYGEITDINLDDQIVSVGHTKVDYDELVIGLGCEDKYHNVPGAEEYTHSIQTLSKSRETFHHISELPNGAKVGIVGAGLSGIELASELRESRSDLQIFLYDRGERILRRFPEKLSKYIEKWFKKHDVTVVPNSDINRVEPGCIYNNDVPEELDLIVWTAGIQPVELVRNLPIDISKGGRVILNQYHQVPTYKNVYVVGDCADLPHAPSAQLAEAQGDQIADVMKLQWQNKPLPEKMPEIKIQGFLGSLGDKKGFAYIMDRTVTGRLASILKSGVLWMYKYHNG